MLIKLFTSSFLLIVFCSFQKIEAQTTVKKAIEKAISSNKVYDGFYIAKPSKRKIIEVEALEKYCEGRYDLRNVKTQKKIIYGDQKTIVLSFEFRDLNNDKNGYAGAKENKGERSKREAGHADTYYEGDSNGVDSYERDNYGKAAKEYQPLLDRIIVGRWTGLIGYFSRTDYEIELRKSGSKYIGRSITGTGHLEVEAYFDADQNFIVKERRDNDPNTRDLKCVKELKLELRLRFDKMDIILKGKVASTDCRSKGDAVQIAKKDSKFILKENIEEALKYLKINKTVVKDSDANGLVDYYEPTCVNVELSNLTPFKYDDVIMTAYGNNRKEEFLLMRDVVTINKNVEGFKGFTSTVWQEVDTNKMKINYKVGHKDMSIQFGESELPLSKKSFSSLKSKTGFTKPDFYGYWSSGDVHLLNLKPDGRFEYSYQGKKLRYGKWVFYTGISCTDDEIYDKLIFYDMTNIHLESGFLENFEQENYSLSSKESKPGETFSISIDMLIGGFKSYSFLRVEEVMEDDALIEELNTYISGKWGTSENFGRFNFQENHRAVQYNPVNQSDEGYWYWTYKMENNTVSCYLWVVLGRVYGVEKYELLINESSNKRAVLRRISGGQDSDKMTIYKDDNLVVPEDVMGLRPDEILYTTLLGNTIEEGLKGGEISNLFKGKDIGEINNNVYTQSLSLIKRLNK